VKNKYRIFFYKIVTAILILTVVLDLCACNERAGKEEVVSLSNPEIVMNQCSCVYFGSYWQEDTNEDGVADRRDEKTPIKWRILSQDGDAVYVVSDRILDVLAYNAAQGSTWETSQLRGWLNHDFLSEAFTEKEQSAILSHQVANTDNPHYGTDGGNDTNDSVFLLSTEDTWNEQYGFGDDSNPYFDEAKNATATLYAAQKNGENTADYVVDGEMSCDWWLRSMGADADRAAIVERGGFVNTGGRWQDHGYGVRPALYLKKTSPYVKEGEELDISIQSVTWDLVKLGTWNSEPITWRVLEVTEQDVFLLSEQIVELEPYEEVKTGSTWEESSIRSWLNETFYQEAFSDREKMGIELYTYTNTDNTVYGTAGGSDTEDYISLLSLEDVKESKFGFPSTFGLGHWTRTIADKDHESSFWWLRSSRLCVCLWGEKG